MRLVGGLRVFDQLPVTVAGIVATAARRIRARALTIRGKILFAFCALAAITGILGGYAVTSVGQAGRLVVETYDKPLMAISYARLALSSFTAMELAISQRHSAEDAARRAALDLRIAELERSVNDSLVVAEERSTSSRAAAAARTTTQQVADWNALRRDTLTAGATTADYAALELLATGVVDALDNLVELTAEDGFRGRQKALQAITTYREFVVVATVVALLLSIIIAVMLARRMVKPIAAASHAARRIAEGELDVEIGPAVDDELGQLLGSMAVMRDNIRRMMEREVNARLSAQTRLVNAIESSDEGVILLDSEGRILLSNSQVIAFFPELADQFTSGCSLPDKIEQALADPTGEISLFDGRWLRLSSSTTADGGQVIIGSDITLLKERETVLREAKEQAESASRSKSEFLANMSHELRTPLNAVLGFSEIIRDAIMGPVDARYQEYANDIYTAGRHLLSLINDVLDLSKIEVGRLELQEENVDITDVVATCNRIIMGRAKEADLNVSIDVPNDIPPVRADERRLKQIVLNLLSNAVKFTPAGGKIVVAARALVNGDVTISVCDTGIGMRPEDVKLALEPFRQIDGALNRRYEGTGLGLPLVQRLVQLHGGSLAIQTAPGSGTTITLRLPADRCIREVA
jgi:signal transduction histidine kinase/HAMP domain-containing protein